VHQFFITNLLFNICTVFRITVASLCARFSGVTRIWCEGGTGRGA